MNYADTVREALKRRMDDYEQWGERKDDLLDLYTLLAMVWGTNTTAEMVHDAWSVHTARTAPEHPSLVPFDDLSEEIQEYDEPYAHVIREVGEVLEQAHRDVMDMEILPEDVSIDELVYRRVRELEAGQ